VDQPEAGGPAKHRNIAMLAFRQDNRHVRANRYGRQNRRIPET
jgi:hypothetical protein